MGIGWFGIIVSLAFIGLGVAIAFAGWYKRCPSDKILVKYGTGIGKDAEGAGLSARCIHGGGEIIWPIIQDHGWLDLTPLTIDIDLTDALSAQNIRVSTPSTYTVGISTEPGIMENAAERLLGESLDDIRNLARDIIFGQMRVVIATMQIEKINADRDQFIQNISKALEPELEKVGLRLINVNIKDVNDKSGYIDALGREAAAEAINEAKKKVAQKERDGEIGKAEAEREQRIKVAHADAEAVEGENESQVQIAESNSDRRQKEAEAEKEAISAEKVNEAKAREEAYRAEKEAEVARAEREEASQRADTVIPAEIEKERIETLAEAEAEEERRRKQGKADGIRSVMEARAEGILAQLESKGEGFDDIVRACQDNPELASLLMITEELPDLVSEQVKAISDIEFDSITVWENGANGDGQTSTANFLSGLIGSLPPLHEVTKNAGVDLPDYLGSLDENGEELSDLSSEQRDTLKNAVREQLEDQLPEDNSSSTGESGDTSTEERESVSSERQASPLSSTGTTTKSPETTTEESQPEQTEEQSASDTEEDEVNQEIRAIVKDNLNRLRSFDQNDNQQFEEEELETAVETLRTWCELMEDDQSQWYYFDESEVKGPELLEDIRSRLSETPGTFVNPSQSEVDAWVPYDILVDVKALVS